MKGQSQPQLQSPLPHPNPPPLPREPALPTPLLPPKPLQTPQIPHIIPLILPSQPLREAEATIPLRESVTLKPHHPTHLLIHVRYDNARAVRREAGTPNFAKEVVDLAGGVGLSIDEGDAVRWFGGEEEALAAALE
jgi:hypothetical protein